MVLECKTKLQCWACSKSAQSSQTAVLGYFLVDLTFFRSLGLSQSVVPGLFSALSPQISPLVGSFPTDPMLEKQEVFTPARFCFSSALKGRGKDEGSQLWV